MSRVSSDDQRIKEMNEAQLRKKKDLEKKDQKTRTEKSFDQVMTDKAGREKAQRLGHQKQAKESGKEKAKTENTTQKVLERNPRDRANVKKRAALLQARNAGQTTKRDALSETARGAETDRTTGLVEQAETEREGLDKEVRKDDLDEARQDAENFYEVRLDRDPQALANPAVERDKGGRGEGGQDSKGDDGSAAAIEKKGGAGGAGKLTPELIERLVGAIYTATQADGRTEVVVSLKGTMLDGVTLRVQKKKDGKIRCTFEGCDKQTKNLIEASKGELMRGLARKGLELDILRVKTAG